MSQSMFLMLTFLLAMPVAAQMGPRGGCCAPGGPAQSAAKAPVTSNPVVEITGTVGQIQIAPGQGAPHLEVKYGSETTRVFLGAMHYLIAENFNPKTGQAIVVKGYKVGYDIVAIQVTLPLEKQTLKLRDENGWPLWRGGPWRGGRGR